ncbi:hypothetical protein IQ268_22280 [Oculatella sp. LEGE 06141]|uniref:hypothetical protein n=1 Tax=Oculatella sp. LEGE 06141 TaxID=1828648 RepID=UPI0018822C47|nr:hypothetical protein [Oculatella sp. LEGE 06141]MBE9181292.1 hypothetical protein [Oculatella sp. LEGE 06141]
MNSNEGVNAGLQIWLIFLIGFALMGYSALISLTMGAIAGGAGGFLVYWLKGTFVLEEDSSTADDKPETGSIFNRARLGFSRIRTWNSRDANETDARSSNWMSKWVRRRPSRRSGRSRRR